ncbi:hypothetical protein TNCT_528251 [Trichonephila clavata]|uniref:Uncharacterized protein n=1 Tax=Trichonephila clavata TaxID=2740835 RepID=A0A8X6GD15_TRICU|nr:hypothetical protein TNCT_528251 [Trichonephila clavata]
MEKVGTMQSRLAWPLRKDDTHKREVLRIFYRQKSPNGRHQEQSRSFNKQKHSILRLIVKLKLPGNEEYLKKDENILSEFSKLLYPAVASI